MSYFTANYSEADFKEAVNEVVVAKLEHAGREAKHFPVMALQLAETASLIAHSLDFHKALIASLSSQDKKKVGYYSCNFFNTIEDNQEILKLWNQGKQKEAIAEYKKHVFS